MKKDIKYLKKITKFIMKHKLILTLLFPILLFGQSIERQVIGSSGGVFTNQNITISYTVGESFISYYKVNDVCISEGFQQGKFTNYTDSGIKDELSDISLKAYPNPTTGTITLRLSKFDINKKYVIGIFDSEYKLIHLDYCLIDDEDEIKIDMRPYAPGIYIVGVDLGGKQKVVLIEKIK